MTFHSYLYAEAPLDRHPQVGAVARLAHLTARRDLQPASVSNALQHLRQRFRSLDTGRCAGAADLLGGSRCRRRGCAGGISAEAVARYQGP